LDEKSKVDNSNNYGSGYSGNSSDMVKEALEKLPGYVEEEEIIK